MTAAPAGRGVHLGYGIGWRPEIDTAAENIPGVDFVEVIAESVDPRRLPDSLCALRARGVPVVPHGVSLNLGGAGRPDRARLAHLAAVADALDAPLVSEHVAFCRAGGLDSGHLLPVPRSRDALAVVAENVRIACAELPVPLALENVAPLLSWPGEDMSEGNFLSELAERTGAGLLVDVANLHTARVNLGQDPVEVMDELPLDRIAYVHLAGGVLREGLWHDTHTRPVSEQVLQLLAELAARVDLPGVLLEWDDAYPPDPELAAELAQIRRTVQAARAGHVLRETRASRVVQMPRAAAAGRGARAGGGGRAAVRTSGLGMVVGPRGRLARAQGKLLAALVAGADVPRGFDSHRVAIQANALIGKRRRAVARILPDIVDVLGERFTPLFHAYAATHPRPAGGSRGDARAFAHHVRQSIDPPGGPA